jgi:hypothetical protein
MCYGDGPCSGMKVEPGNHERVGHRGGSCLERAKKICTLGKLSILSCMDIFRWVLKRKYIIIVPCVISH